MKADYSAPLKHADGLTAAQDEGTLREDECLTPSKSSVQHVSYEGKQQLVRMLREHIDQAIHVQVRDVIKMIADLRGVTRSKMIDTAMMAWFYHALGFPIIEVECHEQPPNEDVISGQIAFRLKLEANYEQELKSLKKGEELSTKIRDNLIKALPGAFTEKSNGTLEHMLQISWTKGGSLELGGVVTVSLVVLVVLALGVAAKPILLDCVCPCFGRSKGASEGAEYANALSDFEHRGVHFEVHPDGSANMILPQNPALEQSRSGSACPCSIL